MGDTPQKTCEQGGLSQTCFFTVSSLCCKVPNVQGMFRKIYFTNYPFCILRKRFRANYLEILRKISQQKIRTTFERYVT